MHSAFLKAFLGSLAQGAICYKNHSFSCAAVGAICVLKLKQRSAKVVVYQERHRLWRKYMEYNFDQVHNYYERQVFEEVARRAQAPEHLDFTADMLADVACLSLNRLPARYVRHDVDMMFYLTEPERQTMQQAMEEVLQFSFALVRERTARSTR
jgi:Late competence development protein ComFB